MEKEEIGVMLLGTTGAFSLWSATNPSAFTILKFNESGEDEEKIRTGMKAGLFSILIASTGIALLYGKRGRIPALATGLTGLGLYAWYDKKLREQSATF